MKENTMSKSQHGNKEAKKPKKARVPTPAPGLPAIAPALPALPTHALKRK
jgi:hypothetical protein